MKKISIISTFLLLIVSTVFINSYTTLYWSLDNEILELLECEKSDSEKETAKTQPKKVEFFFQNTLSYFVVVLTIFSPNANEVDSRPIQCREILTPPPDFF